MDNDRENELFNLVTEINEMTYSMNAPLIKEYWSLLNEDLSSKEIILMDL
ncbi:hypothetical protein [Clostridium sp. UBA2485]|nr:hypothetical protein [Clostridium sp. UBA2485]